MLAGCEHKGEEEAISIRSFMKTESQEYLLTPAARAGGREGGREGDTEGSIGDNTPSDSPAPFNTNTTLCRSVSKSNVFI